MMTSRDEESGCLAVYPLRTDRLLLRPVGPEHVDAMTESADDWDVARYTSRLPFPYERADAVRFVEESVGIAEAGRGVMMALERRGDGVFCGCMGVMTDVDRPSRAELGYWLPRAAWGQGFATEAARAMIAHVFDDWKLARVEALVVPENTASRRVLEKLGFSYTGQKMRAALAREEGEHLLDCFEVTPDRFRAATQRPVVLVSAVALIDPDNRVLLARRPPGKAMAGLWEFPGGKVDPGETPERALIRELHEELGIDVRESCLAPLTFASHAYANFHLLMPLYVCRQWKGRVTPREGQELAWVRPARLRDYEMPAADIPLIPILRDWL